MAGIRKPFDELSSTQQKHRLRMRDPKYAANYRAKRKGTARRRHLINAYGLSMADYKVLLKTQGGVCAICKEPPRHKHQTRLQVDHNHVTGQIRGLLCQHCNSALGYMEDSIPRLAEAIKYLKENE